MVELILVSFSLVLILVYLAIYVFQVGLPTSISETYYKTEKKWLFPTVLGLCVGCCVEPMLELTPEPFKFLAFFVVAGIMFVAAAPAFKESFVGSVHYVSASIAGLAAMVWLILMSGIPFIAIAGIVISLINRKRMTFWLEVGILINIYVVLYDTIVISFFAH